MTAAPGHDTGEVITEAAPADVPALADLLAVLFAQELDFQPDPERQRRGLSRIVADPTVGRVFAARAAGEVVGMVSLLFTVSTALGAPVCWLEDMVVRPDRRGGGLGSRLVEHALAYAARHGFARVTLLTDGVNEGAQRFYARHGFARSEMVVLRRPLAEAPGDA